MTSSTPLSPGEVVLVSFTFTSQADSKRRPAVILSVAKYHASRRDAIMMPLSTKAGGYYGDFPISDWYLAGLPGPTHAKAVIQTIPRSVIETKLGTLTDNDFAQIKQAIRSIIDLS